jgi:hypothetical protein
MKEINELFTGIINQSKMLHLKHNCGESENLVYMATELRNYFDKFKKNEKNTLQAAITLLENIL